MNTVKNLQLQIINLKNGQHTFDYAIEEGFFADFKNSPVTHGHGKVEAKVTKKDTFIRIDFIINMKVILTCDRSLEEFEHELNVKDYTVFKYGDTEDEIDLRVFTIKSNTQKIDLSQYIFEIIILGLPMKKIHPDWRLEADDNEDETVVYTFGEEEIKEDNSNDGEEPIDPRFAALKQLKKK